MVDALRETWRVLVPTGVLIDLRPLPSPGCALEIVTREGAVRVGEVDAAGTAADDAAADRAAARAVEEGWFRARRSARFPFEFRWDTVGEMRSFLEGSPRMRRVRPTYATLEKIRRSWCAGTGGRVRLGFRRMMWLAAYDKHPVARRADR